MAITGEIEVVNACLTFVTGHLISQTIGDREMTSGLANIGKGGLIGIIIQFTFITIKRGVRKRFLSVILQAKVDFVESGTGLNRQIE